MTRFSASTAAVVIACALATAGTAAQKQPAAEGKAGTSAYKPARTPDGQPNISGMWEPGPGRPFENPRGGPWKPPAGATGANGAALPFFARGDQLPGGRSTEKGPMVFAPPDGIIPLQPWAVAKRDET